MLIRVKVKGNELPEQFSCDRVAREQHSGVEFLVLYQGGKRNEKILAMYQLAAVESYRELEEEQVVLDDGPT